MREDVAAGRPANIIGIRLGTTKTMVARLNENGKPEATYNIDGNPITPSVVMFDDKGDVVVGSEAKKFLGTGVSDVFAEFKRELGTGESWSASGRRVTPVELTELLLRKVVGDYAEQYGEPEVIVITWPANFRNEQREATKEAAKRAGLKNVHYLDDPVAAALFYGIDTYLDGKYVVYDFGGGTFDVTLIEAHGNRIEVIYQDGVQQLGGKDLDNALLKIIGEKFREKTGHQFDAVECSFDKLALESNKHILSVRPSVSILLRSVKCGMVRIDVSRLEFESGINHLISQAEMACENVLRRGKDDPSQHIKMSDIKGILMAGDTSCVPAVQESVSQLFGKKPQLKNPIQAIAFGAAIYAAHKASNGTLNVLQARAVADVDIVLVAPHFVGTSVLEDDGSGVFNDTVIAKGTPLPCKVERTYYTRTHNQAVVNVDVTQSAIEERDLNFVTKIWEGSLKLPRGCPAGYPIKVTFSCDINGITSVDVVTGGDQDGPAVTAKLIRPGPTPLGQ